MNLWYNSSNMAQATEISTDHQVNPPQGDVFRPSEYEKGVVRDTIDKFRISADERNGVFALFDGRNLIQYIDDSVKRFTTNVDSREGLEDWQARVNDPFTRNKVLAILGKVASVLPIASFTARGDEDTRKAVILSDLYNYSEDKDNYEKFMVKYLLEAIVKGTAIGYEGMEHYKRVIRDVKGTGDNITVTERKISEIKLFAELVPLEEFYPSSVSIDVVADMQYCFWRKEYPYAQFISKWGNYEKSKDVQPNSTTFHSEDRPFYADYITHQTTPGTVEVIRYYNVIDDCYVIIANGIWLNPITDKGDLEVLSPLPFNHKRLPFFDIRFDFLGDWFYGKSLPDKLSALQDVLNVLTNMLLDQSFLTIFPPLLTNGFDTIEDDYLRPGRRTPIDTQGLPITQAFMKLDLGTPQGWHQFILEYTRKVMEESSVDKTSQGIAGVGGRTTAQEIRVAAEGVAAMLGIFGRMINYAVKQKALLRAPNILQFWTDPNLPYLSGILGDQGDQLLGKAFNLFKVEGATLSSGKRGARVVALYSDTNDAPTAEDLKSRSIVTKGLTGKDVEYLAVDASYLRNVEFDITLVMDQKKETTRDIEKALALEKAQVYLGVFPPGTFDVMEIAAQLAEKMGDDPTKVLNQDFVNQQMLGKTDNKSPIQANPQGQVAKNMADTGSQGMQGGMQNLAQLAGGMTG